MILHIKKVNMIVFIQIKNFHHLLKMFKIMILDILDKSTKEKLYSRLSKILTIKNLIHKMIIDITKI